MASTYTSKLRLVKPTTGELTNTWGDVFNSQFSDLIDTAIAGYTSIAMSDANKTLTATNGVADESRSMMIRMTGTLTAAREVIVPASAKLYFVENATTGGFTLTFKTASGTGIDVVANAKTIVACDGTNVISLIDTLPFTVSNTTNVGYLGAPQISKSANYTLVLSDAGKHIYHPSADTTSRTWTIPANSSVAYPIGTTITFVNDSSAGVILISITTDTLMLAATGSTGTRSLAATGMATAIKITSTKWIINGVGIT